MTLFRNLTIMLLPAALILVVGLGLALGQEAATPAPVAPTVVEFGGFFGWLRPYVLELVSLVIGGAVLWASRKFHQLTGIEVEAKHREALQSALRSGANLAIGKIPTGGKIDVHSAPVASAIRYVLESVPDAVAYFELTPERIGDLLKPKLVAPAAVVVKEGETVTVAGAGTP